MVAVADADEGAGLRLLLGAAVSLHLLLLFLPAAAHQVNTGRRAEEPETQAQILRMILDSNLLEISERCLFVSLIDIHLCS